MVDGGVVEATQERTDHFGAGVLVGRWLAPEFADHLFEMAGGIRDLEHGARHDVGGGRDLRCFKLEKVTVVERELAEETGHSSDGRMERLRTVHVVTGVSLRSSVGVFDEVLHRELETFFKRGTAERPFERRQDVSFHLHEHLLVIGIAAHDGELLERGHPGLLVLVLGRYPQGRAPHELVVALEYDTLGAISVNDIEAAEEGLGLELEGAVEFDNEVEQKRTHEPLDLWLQVDHGRVDVAGGLEVGQRTTDVLSVFIDEFFVGACFQEFKNHRISTRLSRRRAVAASIAHVTRT